LRGPTSKERGREGRGRKGPSAHPPHYLEEVYAYAAYLRDGGLSLLSFKRDIKTFLFSFY